jgi:hypothetical protein
MRSSAVVPWLVLSTLASCSGSERLCSLTGCVQCDPAIFVLRETPQYGADAAPGAETITAVRVTGEHDSISMTIARDGVPLLSSEVSPEYRGVEINGEGCGECPQAEHTVGS